jgi:epsilon-lactone hydrolase
MHPDKELLMPSFSSRLVTGLLIVTRYRDRLDSPSKVERYVREHSVRPAPYAPPGRLDRTAAFSADTRHGWTCYSVVPRNSPKPTGQVLYVHGGGFIDEIISLHWSLIAKVATRGPVEVTVPIYPLAPHSTASQTVSVATDIAADLIARSGAEQVTLMGDSAGGNIVLGIAQTLRHRGLAQPRQLILISPVLDVSKSNPSIASVAGYDRVLSLAGSTAGQQLYASGLDSKDPLVSPLYANLTGLAPMVLFSGTHDIHNPDARDFAGRARDAESLSTTTRYQGPSTRTPCCRPRRARRRALSSPHSSAVPATTDLESDAAIRDQKVHATRDVRTWSA